MSRKYIMKLIALLIVVLFVLVAITPSRPPEEEYLMRPQFRCICMHVGVDCPDCKAAIARNDVNFYCQKCYDLRPDPEQVDAELLRAAQ